MLPSLSQEKYQSLEACRTGSMTRLRIQTPKACEQRQASMNNRDSDPANIQMCFRNIAGVDAVEGIDGMDFGALRPEFYWEKLGLATKWLRN